jgi:hypothetical protein
MTDKEQKRKEYLKAYYQAKKDKMKEQSKAYTEANKDKLKEYQKAYAEANKDKMKEYKKAYAEANKDKMKEYNRKYNLEYRKNRIKNDPLFKLKLSIRNSISISFKRNGFKKLSQTEIILGCTFDEFKTYLESKFEPWMTWENKGLYNGTANYGWDIDHIIPSSSGKTQEELLKLNHYTNLQPLCSYYNRDIKKDN